MVVGWVFCCLYRYVHWLVILCWYFSRRMRLIYHSNKTWTTFLRSWPMLYLGHCPLLLCSGCPFKGKIHLASCWLLLPLPLQPFQKDSSCYRYLRSFSWLKFWLIATFHRLSCLHSWNTCFNWNHLLRRLVRWLWTRWQSKKSSTMRFYMTQLMILWNRSLNATSSFSCLGQIRKSMWKV